MSVVPADLQLPEQVGALCTRLSESAADLEQSGRWPQEQLTWCADAGVFRWFVPKEFGGYAWSEEQILSGYLALSRSCLTTTFILTQWNAACKRIIGSGNQRLRAELLPALADGSLFATVGISHLSTSRQHVSAPVLSAVPQADGSYVLNGFSPWVTAAPAADVIVIGATLPDGTQIIAALPTETPGVQPRAGASLVALNGSCTDQVDLRDVRVDSAQILAGPVSNVLSTNSGGGTGGLQTSTLAIGLSWAATEFIEQQAEIRNELEPVARKLKQDCLALTAALTDLTAGLDAELSASDLRQRANSLVLRSTQAALTSAKGAGFVASHPTGRWAREALFFLVWSCPQPVAAANLCELAQLS